MATNRSPVAPAASLSQGVLDNYLKVTAARVAELNRNAAVYANKEPALGPVETYGKIFAEASFVPADPSRYVAGRNGRSPSFVVLCRVSESTDKPENANILSAISEYTSAIPNRTAAPHILIGYTGEVVQFLDLDDTSRFLGNSAPPPAALSADTLTNMKVDSVIEFTVAHEAGAAGYAALNRNDNGRGISWGFIQFNQASSLAKLFALMNEKDPASFSSIFGDIATDLLNPAWVQDLRHNLAGLEGRLNAAAQVPAFQQAQRQLARQDYWEAAARAAATLGLTSQRAYAMLFDTAVQRGAGYLEVFLVKDALQVQGVDNRLTRIANTADTMWYDPKTKTGVKDATPYTRRRNLRVDTRLSDAPLMQASLSTDVASTELVSDDTSVVVMLEGRTGDPVTTRQRDAAARILKSLSEVAAVIPLTTSRMFGLDMTRASRATANSNPGQTFSYLDLLSAAADAPKAGAGVFKAPAPPTGQAVQDAMTALSTSLQAARADSGLSALAVLSAYSDAAGLRRANSLASFDKRSQWAAAQQEGAVRKATEQQAASDASTAAAAAAQPIPTMDRAQLVGVIFDFSTGYWTDNKAVGKIGKA
jgi:hypothetical protein